MSATYPAHLALLGRQFPYKEKWMLQTVEAMTNHWDYKWAPFDEVFKFGEDHNPAHLLTGKDKKYKCKSDKQ